MALPERPGPMNAITHHSKVKVSVTVPDPTFVAGKYVSGKVEMECRADKGLGIGVIMVELFGIQGAYFSNDFHLFRDFYRPSQSCLLETILQLAPSYMPNGCSKAPGCPLPTPSRLMRSLVTHPYPRITTMRVGGFRLSYFGSLCL